MSRYTRAKRHLLRQYERAVDRIDEEDRAIFLGHRVEELSYRQLSNFIWLPIGGALSDRFGRTPILLIVPIVVLVVAYPLMSMLVAAPTFGGLATVLLTLSACFGLYNGAMIARLTEITPPATRTLGFSLSFSLATSIFGGFTPLICTALISATGNKAAPALWLCFGAAISLIGVFASRKRGAAVTHVLTE